MGIAQGLKNFKVSRSTSGHAPYITSTLKELLLQKSVRTGTFTPASGKKSDLFYIDCRMRRTSLPRED